MTHSQVELGYMLTVYGWLPICFLVFIYMMYRVGKKLMKSRMIKEGTLTGQRKISAIVLWYSIPSLVVLIVMVLPVFYFNHLVKQEDYCMTIVRVNKMTTIDNKFLQERCSSFELNELIKRTYEVQPEAGF